MQPYFWLRQRWPGHLVWLLSACAVEEVRHGVFWKGLSTVGMWACLLWFHW